MALAHVLLGLLADGPAHGYDLKRGHDARFSTVKPLAFGQVYATLQRLERDGLVAVAGTEPGAGGPERTSYALTDAGRDALAAWLGEVEVPGPYAADDLVRRTVTALHLGGDAAGYLDRQRRTHLEEMRRLSRVLQDLDDPVGRIALDHTIAHLDADLRWLEETRERISG